LPCAPRERDPHCVAPAVKREAEEDWGRYGTYLDLKSWRRFVSSAGFVELTHYYRPAGLTLERQPWLASIWRRERGEATLRCAQSRSSRSRLMRSAVKDRRRDWPGAMIMFRSPSVHVNYWRKFGRTC